MVAPLAVPVWKPARAQVPDWTGSHGLLSHRETSVNGVRLHREVGGTGNPTLLAHGVRETWYVWPKVTTILGKQHT